MVFFYDLGDFGIVPELYEEETITGDFMHSALTRS
jgi:hypothetical protein